MSAALCRELLEPVCQDQTLATRYPHDKPRDLVVDGTGAEYLGVRRPADVAE